MLAQVTHFRCDFLCVSFGAAVKLSMMAHEIAMFADGKCTATWMKIYVVKNTNNNLLVAQAYLGWKILLLVRLK